ncbi:MAG: hypothetical protein ACYC2I_01580 [Elusimicrobiales bacterium]
MDKTRVPYFVLLTLLGVFFIVFGEHDDSPGAQGLGLLLVIISIAGIVKRLKRTSGKK